MDTEKIKDMHMRQITSLIKGGAPPERIAAALTNMDRAVYDEESNNTARRVWFPEAVKETT